MRAWKKELFGIDAHSKYGLLMFTLKQVNDIAPCG